MYCPPAHILLTVELSKKQIFYLAYVKHSTTMLLNSVLCIPMPILQSFVTVNWVHTEIGPEWKSPVSQGTLFTYQMCFSSETFLVKQATCWLQFWLKWPECCLQFWPKPPSTH